MMRTCPCGTVHETTYYASTPERPDECTSCWIRRSEGATVTTKRSKKSKSTEVKVTPDATLATELEAERTSVTQAMVELREFDISTREDLEIAGSLLEDVVLRRKAIDAKLKSITAPMRAAESEVRALFKPVQNAMEEAESWLRKRIAEAHANIEARNQKLLEATRTAVESGQSEAAADLAGALQSTAAPEGMTYRDHWTFEIVDPSLLPREYLQPNEQAIRAVVKALKGSANIPGVRVFSEKRVTVG